MNEGVFRILRALQDGAVHPRTQVIRASGESHSVLAALELDKGKWFERRGPDVQLTEAGQKAHAYEADARTPKMTLAQLCDAMREKSRGRPGPKRELDQVHATLETTAKRAMHLMRHGETQRGLLFLGDDDLTSLAVALLLDQTDAERKVRVLDLDPELIGFLGAHPRIDAQVHDVREPLPRALHGKSGCVFTDPPYAPAGFALFISRAATALKDDGRLYVSFGQSRRASERGLAKQRLLADLGVLVEHVYTEFNEYEGAESIGSRSALWVARRTPQTKPLTLDPEAPLYTRDAPAETTTD